MKFGLRGIPLEQQRQFPAIYKVNGMGTSTPDLIAFDSIVAESKFIPAIGDYEREQVLNYLKTAGLQIGLIPNFSKPKLEWERLVLQIIPFDQSQRRPLLPNSCPFVTDIRVHS